MCAIITVVVLIVGVWASTWLAIEVHEDMESRAAQQRHEVKQQEVPL